MNKEITEIGNIAKINLKVTDCIQGYIKKLPSLDANEIVVALAITLVRYADYTHLDLHTLTSVIAQCFADEGNNKKVRLKAKIKSKVINLKTGKNKCKTKKK